MVNLSNSRKQWRGEWDRCPLRALWVQEVTCQLAAAVSRLGVLAGTEEDEEALFIKKKKNPYFKIF